LAQLTALLLAKLPATATIPVLVFVPWVVQQKTYVIIFSVMLAKNTRKA